ncbi:MAG: glutaminyl-peptide cyclotransferase [Gammaproteobacteria bacterium]
MPAARACALAALAVAGFSCASEPSRGNFLRYEIVATHPHDVASFTQGLAVHEGRIVESSGLFGRSALALRTVASAAPLKRHALPRDQFGEGVAGDGQRFVQLTWQSGVAHVYDLALKPVGRFSYDGEGWGLAWDGRRWLMSDGSGRIVARDRQTFVVLGSFEVTDRGRPVTQINELEFARGKLYANIWHADRIAVIDPGTGAVEAWLDLAALRRGFARPAGWDEAEHVLNGIAFNPASGHFFVTGKCWPVLFEIRLLDPG